MVLVGDTLKGVIGAAMGMIAAGSVDFQVEWAFLAGFAAVVGHCYPIFHRFRGGKGVATGGGVGAVMAPIAFPVLIVIWFLTSRLTGKASLASIVVTVLLPVGVLIETGEWWEMLAIIGVCALVMIRHAGNIARLAGAPFDPSPVTPPPPSLGSPRARSARAARARRRSSGRR